MRPKAYQSTLGWCCSLCHLPIPLNPLVVFQEPAAVYCKCKIHTGDEYHAPYRFDFSGINDRLHKFYGFGYDTWRLRLQYAADALNTTLTPEPLAFRVATLRLADAAEKHIRASALRAKPRRTVVDVLEDLTPRQAQVVTLRAHGASHREIASILEITEGGSRNLLSQARCVGYRSI